MLTAQAPDHTAPQSIVAAYEAAFAAHGNSLDAMFLPKDRQRERFDSLTHPFPQSGFSVLDYGCGLAHLHTYLSQRHDSFGYTGVDLVPSFIEENQRLHPYADFRLIERVDDIAGSYDFVVLCGVFNLRYTRDEAEHMALVHATLRHLFACTHKVLCVNFLSDAVDFQQPEAFHQNPMAIWDFARENLSPRVRIDHSYMPYEFSLLIYKDAHIVRPINTYRSI